MKIPIKEAVNSGTWYDCAVNGLNFRFKVSSFIKGNNYLLKLEVVNLCKSPINGHDIANTILLVDQWEYEFSNHRYDFRDNPKSIQYTLNPKLKYVGTIWYRIPEEEAEYYVSVKGAIVKEV